MHYDVFRNIVIETYTADYEKFTVKHCLNKFGMPEYVFTDNPNIKDMLRTQDNKKEINMTPYQKFEERATLVQLWREQQKPKIKNYGCDDCRYCYYTHDEYERFYTPNYATCRCLPNIGKPIARVNECPKTSNPDAGSLRSVCYVNSY